MPRHCESFGYAQDLLREESAFSVRSNSRFLDKLKMMVRVELSRLSSRHSLVTVQKQEAIASTATVVAAALSHAEPVEARRMETTIGSY